MQARQASDWAGLAVLTVIWGSSFALTKIAVETISPMWIVTIRMVIGALALIAVALWRRQSLPLGRPYLIWYVWLAIVGTLIPFFLISWGTARTESGTAGILMATVPLFAIGLAHIFLTDEPLSLRRAAGFGVGFVGLLIVMGWDAVMAFGSADGDGLAKIAITGAAVCYAVHGVMARRAPPMSPLQLALGEIGMGAILSIPLVLAFPPPDLLTVSWGSIAAVIALGIFPTAVAGLVLFQLLERVGVGFLAYCNYLIPVFSVGLGVMVLGEKLGPTVLAGLAVILVGIAVSETRKMPRGQQAD